jgi:hypothetical protein
VISLGVNEEAHFRNLARALGRDDWLGDARFGEREARKAHADALAAEIEAELAKRTAEEWEPILQGAGVPSARLRTMPEALASEQVRTRGFVQSLPTGVAVPTLPFRLGGAPNYAPKSGAPTHGEHSAEIADWLAESGSWGVMMGEADVSAARAVLDAHIVALNARDEAAIAQTLHFPHVRLSGTALKVWETPERYFSDFRARAGDRWARSGFSDVRLVDASPDKVHFDVLVTRYDGEGTEIARFRSLWVITCEAGRWAAKIRSSFAAK